MNEQSCYRSPVGLFNAASNRFGLLMALLLLVLLAACSSPLEVEVTVEREVIVETEVEVIQEVTVETIREVEVTVEVTREVDGMADSGSAIRPKGIVSSIVNAPIVSDGNVTGALTDFVINLNSLMSPDVPGRTLLEGKQIRITLPEAFVNMGNVPTMDAFACGMGECDTAILLQGWPQHPIFSSFPPGDLEGDIRYEISMDGSNTLVITALEDLDGSSPAPGPGIKTIHVLLGSFVNPAPGQYEIVVEAETGVDGALEIGSAPFEVIAEPAPALAFTSVFNGEGNPNAIYQQGMAGESVGIPYHLLLWGADNAPMDGASVKLIDSRNWAIVHDGREVGHIAVQAPDGATGVRVSAENPAELINAPISGYPVGHLTVDFEIGNAAGAYVIDFSLEDGNSLRAFVDAAAAPAAPHARTWHGTAWDTKRSRMIIAGGRMRGQSLPDGGTMHNIWAFDAASQSWEVLADFSDTLSDIEFDRVSYDSSRDLLIMHALGIDAETPVLTYHYDFETGEIVESSAENRPVARFEHNFIYHPGSDKHIMFGGITWDIENTYGETWAYDAGEDSWSMETTSGEIPTRGRAAFAYDSDTDRILTYGGHTGHLFSGENLADTWAYDVAANSWEEIVTDEVPMLDPQVTGAYDAQSQRFVIFGRNSEGIHETWALDVAAGTWTNMQPEGGPSTNHPGDAIYSPEMDRMLTFGGNINWPEVPTTSAELWAYDYDNNTWELIEPK